MPPEVTSDAFSRMQLDFNKPIQTPESTQNSSALSEKDPFDKPENSKLNAKLSTNKAPDTTAPPTFSDENQRKNTQEDVTEQETVEMLPAPQGTDVPAQAPITQSSAPKIKKIAFPKEPQNQSLTQEKTQEESGPQLKDLRSQIAAEKLRKFQSRPASNTELTEKGLADLKGIRRATTQLSPRLEEQRHHKTSIAEEAPQALSAQPQDELLEPEDLYQSEANSLDEIGGSDLDERLWETPAADPTAVLRRVKSSLSNATEQAGKWTRRGLKAGQHLSQDAVSSLKAPRRTSIEQSCQEIPLETEAVSKSSSAGLLKRAVGPLSGLCACALVYWAGQGLLEAGGIRASDFGSKIPDLGMLEANNEAEVVAKTSSKQRDLAQKQVPESSSAMALAKYQRVDPKAHTAAPSKETRAREPFKVSENPPPMKTETTPMPNDLSYPGKGLLEVVTSKRELIYVDGVFIGRGPLRRIPLEPGEHEIRIQNGSLQRLGEVQLVAAQRNRAVFAAF